MDNSTMKDLAQKLALALNLKPEVPETFAGLTRSGTKTRKQLRQMRVTLLQGNTSNTKWIKAKRAVIMNQEGEVTRYLGIAIPMSDGTFATYK